MEVMEMQLVMFATQSAANRSEPNLTGADTIVFVCFVLFCCRAHP